MRVGSWGAGGIVGCRWDRGVLVRPHAPAYARQCVKGSEALCPRLPRKRRKGGPLLPHTLVVPPHPVRSSAAHLDVRSGDLEQRGLVPSPRWAPGLGLGASSVFTDFSRQPHEAGVYPHQHHRPHFTADTQRAAKRPTPGQTAARGRGATGPREPGSFLYLRGAS